MFLNMPERVIPHHHIHRCKFTTKSVPHCSLLLNRIPVFITLITFCWNTSVCLMRIPTNEDFGILTRRVHLQIVILKQLKMKNIATNLLMAMCTVALLVSCGTDRIPVTGSIKAAARLQKDLKGTYEELFGERTLLNPKWDAFWLSECEKAVGTKAAQATVDALKASMSGTLTGDAATELFGDGSDGWQNGFQFNCDFKQGVSRFVFDGKGGIKGIDASGGELFSHKYVFDSYNADYDFYFFKSKDGNEDEFSCFAIRPDTPASTHHIEFRYGTGVESLSQFCTGKYAYWMAAGVLENSDKEQQKSIRLFVEENTSY